MFEQIESRKTSAPRSRMVLAIAAALVAVLWLGGSALAAGKSGGSKGGGKAKSAQKSAGSKKGKGSAKHHHHHHKHGHHWARSRYYASYGCTLYYDEDEDCYYYWCQPDNCYYPVSYCPYGRYSW
jgi:hypothetical protein